MKILIDGRSITPQTSGIGRYIYELIKGYINAYGNENVTVLLNQPIIDFPYQYLVCPYQRHSFIDNVRFSFFLKRCEYDIFHSGDMTGPFWHGRKRMHIITIHDLMFLTVPSFYKLSLARKILRKIKNFLFFYFILRDADLRISVSKTTQSDVKRYYLLDSIILREGLNKISNNNFVQQYRDLSYHSFFLYVGLGSPHKNINFMVDAFLKAETDKKLVICGKGHTPVHDERIIYTGWIQDEVLDFLYRNCAAFIFPSLYEGFGLPILEALSYHCRVFSSNAGSLGEFSSRFVYFFHPKRQNELIDLIERCEELQVDINGIDKYLENFNWKNIWKEFHQKYSGQNEYEQKLRN